MHADVVCCLYMLSKMGKRKKEKKKTTPFGINSTRSQVLYQAAQIIIIHAEQNAMCVFLCRHRAFVAGYAVQDAPPHCPSPLQALL